jgi:hypothetical protein
VKWKTADSFYFSFIAALFTGVCYFVYKVSESWPRTESWFIGSIFSILGICIAVEVAQDERRRRYMNRKRLCLCLSCGYDLTGNVSGTCPECGGKVG